MGISRQSTEGRRMNGIKEFQRISVLVKISGRDPKSMKSRASSFYKSKDGITTLSASGLLCPWMLNKREPQLHIVLTDASIVWPFLNKSSKECLEHAIGDNLIPGTCISVIMQSGEHEEHRLIDIEVRLMGFMPYPKLMDAHNSQPDNCTMSERKPQISPAVGYFAVLEAKSSLVDDAPLIPSSRETSEILKVYAIGSPFGCISSHHFMNCIVNGLLLNSGSIEGILANQVLDANLLPGMEGGIVVGGSPLCLLGVLPRLGPGTRHGFLSIASIMEALQKWAAKSYEPSIPRRVNHQTCHNFEGVHGKGATSWNADCLVKIKLSTGHWGSGVIVHRSGTIVICAHLFREYGDLETSNVEVEILCGNSDCHKGVLVYKFQGFLDIAIVEFCQPPERLAVATLWDGDYSSLPGTDCFAAGFGTKSDSNHLIKPTWNSGNVSKVIKHLGGERETLMLISAVPVYPGSSGGGLFCECGRLLGLLTGNISHSTGLSISHCSFSIPVHWIKNITRLTVNREKACSLLRDMDSGDEFSKLVWSLASTDMTVSEEKPGGPTFRAFMRNYNLSGLPINAELSNSASKL